MWLLFSLACTGGTESGTKYAFPCIERAWYEDGDGDGLGDVTTRTDGCGPPATAGWVDNGDDCDDTTSTLGTRLWVIADADGDGHAPIGAVASWMCVPRWSYGQPPMPSDDCDDLDALTYPGADEVVCDGVDHDCDGAVTSSDCPAGALAVAWLDDAQVQPLYDAGDVDGDGLGDLEGVERGWYAPTRFTAERLTTGGVLNQPRVPWGDERAPMPVYDAAARPVGTWGANGETREPDGGGDPYEVWLTLDWYPAGATSPTVRLVAEEGASIVDAALGDLDGDGTPDPVMTVRTSTSSWTTRWYPSSAGFAPTAGVTWVPAGSLASGGDVDGDGRDDWLTYGSDGVAVYHEPPAEGVVADFTFPGSTTGIVRLADADGDGHDDLIVSDRQSDDRTSSYVDVYTDPASGAPSTIWDVTDDDAFSVHRARDGVWLVGWPEGASALEAAPIDPGGRTTLAAASVVTMPGHGTLGPYTIVDVGDLDGDGVRDIAAEWTIPYDPWRGWDVEIDLWSGDL